MRVRFRVLVIAFLALVVDTPAFAQTKPAPMVEAVVGSSGFVDEVFDYFLTAGGGARWFVTPKIAIGPEFVYMTGADDASNLTITGNLTFDFIRDTTDRRIVPYLAVGGGYLRQRTIVGSGPGSPALQPFTSGEGTVSGGVGVRIALGRRAYVAPEFRMGYEPETRFTVMIGFRPGR